MSHRLNLLIQEVEKIIIKQNVNLIDLISLKKVIGTHEIDYDIITCSINNNIVRGYWIGNFMNIFTTRKNSGRSFKNYKMDEKFYYSNKCFLTRKGLIRLHEYIISRRNKKSIWGLTKNTSDLDQFLDFLLTL